MEPIVPLSLATIHPSIHPLISGLEANVLNLTQDVAELKDDVHEIDERMTTFEKDMGIVDQMLLDAPLLANCSLDETGADLAEWFPLTYPDEPVEAGDVVELLGGTITRNITG